MTGHRLSHHCAQRYQPVHRHLFAFGGEVGVSHRHLYCGMACELRDSPDASASHALSAPEA